ncbi:MULTISPECIES: hypothetical protein [Acidiphilium]|jgi:hypothetical protein|uniref:Uncharacterized protein n=1 Tax=Acidiphilium multivorum (strain DSM 11245 / JCM 8867 / NBRC 100883 / AIU 301) TaxID=926570 RepID=F0J0Z8_ACIMA|nr:MULTISPECIES: hypothetical protein [Acidiphilium]MBS3023448.1 hypothetical protein [Acidiphilium multivorum]BAJ79380.1 hypothetical protein ACMV_00330 [Acidiphilium multivorum AIU301]GAN73174.1 hypothetical protein Apmu_0058_05 [Acidiphilium multivorum AIU301]
MTQFAPAKTADHHEPIVSPLILVDRLISLAQDAERAGLPAVANRLVRLALRSCVPPAGGTHRH